MIAAGSYRRRDALLWPIGVGGLIFMVIAWRVAFLPYRDWAPRPDEASRVRWLHGGQLDGLWYLAGEADRGRPDLEQLPR